MKIVHLIGASLLLCCLSLSSQAQFLKKLGDKIERKVEQRIDRKTDQAIDKSLDKAEEGTEKVVKDATSSEKNTGENQEQVEQKKPAPLPENYQLAVTGSGPDIYLQYRMTVSAQQSSEYEVDMRMKMYASPGSGMGRSEMIMNMPMVGEMNMVMLTNAKDPLHIVVVNDRRKEYSILDLSEVKDIDPSSETFTVTKLGEENVHGLDCVHSRAVNQDGDSFELWTTKDVPGYEKMMALYSKSQRMGSDDLWKKLEEVGGAGFMVKMKVETKDGAYVMELTEINKAEVPESLFQIPSGYEEKQGGWVKRFMYMGK